MTSSKKKSLKKVLRVSIIVIIIFILVSSVATKLVYDSIFDRYDSGKDTMQSVGFADYSHHNYMCGENKLSGHLYNTEKSDDIIIIVPGFHAETDNFVPYINEFCKNGFDVFTFDPTGHGESEGDSCIGFPQIINDLNSTIDYLSSKTDYENIYLFGHSRGGYAACCALKDNDNVSGVVSVSGVDSSMDAIMALSTDAVGFIAYGNYPFLSLYETMLFGSELSSRSASECISESDVPVMIIQGKNDEDIPSDSYSIYSKKEDILSDNAKFVLYDNPGKDGHTSILFDNSQKANPDIVKYAVDFFKNDISKENS